MNPRRTRLRQRLLTGVVVALILLVAFVWRVSAAIGSLFGNWAVDAVTERSGGVYQLALSRVRIHWLRPSVTVDSIRFTTNVELNRGRTEPLTEVEVALDGCTLHRLQIVALARGSGLIAHSFDCRKGRVVVNGVRRPVAVARSPFLVLRGGPRTPRHVPRLKVDTLEFPDLDVRVRIPRTRGETQVAVHSARWSLADFDMDPADSATAGRPLFSRVIELAADTIVVRPDSELVVRAAQLRASLTDSTLDARNLRFGPALSDSAFARSRPYRRDLVRFRAARARLRGIDYGALVLGSGLSARHIVMDSLQGEITSDKRRPPHPHVRGTPQQWFAALDQPVDLDSVVVHSGQIVYREQQPDRVGPGTLTFAAVEAVATPVRSGRTIVFAATALLQRTGRLDVRFTVPLAARTYDMAFSGKLGPMPATALNEFLERVYPWRIEKGQVQRITFHATVRNGVATGNVTPLYNDLSINVTGRGDQGLIGTGGVVGDVARGVANLMAASKINETNTAAAGEINHPFTRHETLPGFVWHSLRQGLLAVVKSE
jgi:hypothetical protein